MKWYLHWFNIKIFFLYIIVVLMPPRYKITISFIITIYSGGNFLLTS